MTICYMDKTFCKFYKDCKDGDGCVDALTEEVKQSAKKWWEGFNSINPTPPIASHADKPSCFIKKESE